MPEQNDLELLLRSRTPVIVIESLEEPRILQLFTRLGLRLGQAVFQWSVTEGLKRQDVDFGSEDTNSRSWDALKYIKSAAQPGLYLLLDFHPYINNPLHVRLIKEIAQGYPGNSQNLGFHRLLFCNSTGGEASHCPL